MSRTRWCRFRPRRKRPWWGRRGFSLPHRGACRGAGVGRSTSAPQEMTGASGLPGAATRVPGQRVAGPPVCSRNGTMMTRQRLYAHRDGERRDRSPTNGGGHGSRLRSTNGKKQRRLTSAIPDQGPGHTDLDFPMEWWVRAIQCQELRAPGK